MSKLNEIVQDAQLESSFINYIGFQYLEQHWEDNMDPNLPYQQEEFALLYEEMKNGAFSELVLALQQQHGLTQSDPNFDQLLAAAMAIIEARHGMQAILASAREFLHVLQSPEDDEELDGPVAYCDPCDRIAIAIGLEDLPVELLHTPGLQVGHTYGFCPRCKGFIL